MQRRHAMSPNSIEAIRLRGFCETLRQTRTRNEINESSSESEAFCQYMNIGSNRSQVNFAAPSAWYKWMIKYGLMGMESEVGYIQYVIACKVLNALHVLEIVESNSLTWIEICDPPHTAWQDIHRISLRFSDSKLFCKGQKLPLRPQQSRGLPVAYHTQGHNLLGIEAICIFESVGGRFLLYRWFGCLVLICLAHGNPVYR